MSVTCPSDISDIEELQTSFYYMVQSVVQFEIALLLKQVKHLPLDIF